MNIVFDRIDIENFRSIQKASICLANRGTVIVKGVNEYEEKATSNGSGKSSMFEAIIYALFEETSSGEKDVANRIINNGFNIVLYFSIDLDKYIITRYMKNNKAGVILYKNDEDISARNKTDTNKLICSILGITKDIFLDSVFLSQNISTNLASLSPTARKERLEILTNTEYMINNFKENLKNEQTKYEANCVKAKMDLTKLDGKLDSINKQKLELQEKILQIEKQIAKRNALGDIDTIENEIETTQKNVEIQRNDMEQKEQEIIAQENKITDYRNTGDTHQKEREELNNILFQKREECNEIQHNIDDMVNQNKHSEKEILRINNEIIKIKNSDTCPTCGRKYENINEEHIQNTIKELEQNINAEEDNKLKRNAEIEKSQELLNMKIAEGKKLRAKLDSFDAEMDKYKQELNNMEMVKKSLMESKQRIYNNIKILQANIESLRNKKDEILKIEIGNEEEFISMIQGLDSEIEAINISKKEIEDYYKQNSEYVEVVKNSIQLVTKEFRTYLLQNSINYLNELLNSFSSELFSNDKDTITINGDDTKLDIKLGEATYESLSGGEKTRVNIALLLAQKSLASIIGNISCNIIILDEILGYCDSQAENNVINLITKELNSLESIYMVSHKEIPIGYDNQILVIKDQKGISRIRDY